MSHLNNVHLTFSRYGIHGLDRARRIYWLASAELTYLSPSMDKKKVTLDDIGPLTTAQKNRFKLHFCSATVAS